MAFAFIYCPLKFCSLYVCSDLSETTTATVMMNRKTDSKCTMYIYMPWKNCFPKARESIFFIIGCNWRRAGGGEEKKRGQKISFSRPSLMQESSDVLGLFWREKKCTAWTQSLYIQSVLFFPTFMQQFRNASLLGLTNFALELHNFDRESTKPWYGIKRRTKEIGYLFIVLLKMGDQNQ